MNRGKKNERKIKKDERNTRKKRGGKERKKMKGRVNKGTKCNKRKQK